MLLNRTKNRNKERIENSILNILNNVLKFEIYDIDIKKCSFTFLKLSDDKSYCEISVDTYNRKNIDEYVKKLNNSKSVFKKSLAKELNMWKIPQIHFSKDKIIDRVTKIDEIFKKINVENKVNEINIKK